MSTKYRQPPSAPLHDPIIPNSFGQRQRHDYHVITRKKQKSKKRNLAWLLSYNPAGEDIYTRKGRKNWINGGPHSRSLPVSDSREIPLAPPPCRLPPPWRASPSPASLRYLQVNKPAREIRILIIHPPAYNIPKEKKTKARRDATHASKREASAAVSTKEANTAWVLFSCLAAA